MLTLRVTTVTSPLVASDQQRGPPSWGDGGLADPYRSPRKSQTKEARILPLKGRLGLRRSRKAISQTKRLSRLSMRFTASEPATNKALQEMSALGGLWAVESHPKEFVVAVT